MNQFSKNTLKTLRKLYIKTRGVQPSIKLNCEKDPEVVSRIIYDKLISNEAAMIARFGAFELNTIVNYLGIMDKNIDVLKYIRGERIQWWWNEKTLRFMQSNAGFFPATERNAELFSELMLRDIQQVDVLGSWQEGESYLQSQLKASKLVALKYLDPYWSKTPWTKALENKRILVIHPFADTILRQYNRREDLFGNGDILPQFLSLQTIKAVQSIGGAETNFQDWFEALDYMKMEIDKYTFDICLIGCGAYGFPLAAHVKRKNKKAVHMGGSLQLLFGIKGQRWDNLGLYNEHWVRPAENEKPKLYSKVEDGCYW